MRTLERLTPELMVTISFDVPDHLAKTITMAVFNTLLADRKRRLEEATQKLRAVNVLVSDKAMEAEFTHLRTPMVRAEVYGNKVSRYQEIESASYGEWCMWKGHPRRPVAMRGAVDVMQPTAVKVVERYFRAIGYTCGDEATHRQNVLEVHTQLRSKKRRWYDCYKPTCTNLSYVEGWAWDRGKRLVCWIVVKDDQRRALKKLSGVKLRGTTAGARGSGSRRIRPSNNASFGL
jgi:hypothetical protein